MLEIDTLVLGPVETNVYLAADNQTGDCVIIDPAWDGELIANTAEKRGLTIREIWLTHAHFDHLGGVAALANRMQVPLNIALHPADMQLWKAKGGAGIFGFNINPGPQPEKLLRDGELLRIGEIAFQVRHTPGHTPGHVVYYSESEKVAFCGDLIFAGGIGRTDLPGGNFQQLMESIRSQILTLNDDVVLYPGHGFSTQVGVERTGNFFLTNQNQSRY